MHFRSHLNAAWEVLPWLCATWPIITLIRTSRAFISAVVPQCQVVVGKHRQWFFCEWHHLQDPLSVPLVFISFRSRDMVQFGCSDNLSYLFSLFSPQWGSCVLGWNVVLDMINSRFSCLNLHVKFHYFLKFWLIPTLLSVLLSCFPSKDHWNPVFYNQ